MNSLCSLSKLCRGAARTLALASVVLVPANALALTCDVVVNDITNELVPQHLVHGDREFDGHGPDIKTRANLKIGGGGHQLLTDIYFDAKETQPDWSETEQNFNNLVVWNAPAGATITRIVSDDHSAVQFRSVPGGFQILGPTSDWGPIIDFVVLVARTVAGDSEGGDLGEACRKLGVPDLETCKRKFKDGLMTLNQDNHVHVEPPDSGDLVSAFFIVGDTGGDDISDDNNGKDDTRIVRIAFNKVRVDLAGATSCPTLPPERMASSDVGGASSPLTQSSSTCADAVQGKIAWNDSGSTGWKSENIEKLCRGAENSVEPAHCFDRVMHGGINWGGGTHWKWQNALELCGGSTNSNATLNCFQSQIKAGRAWKDAIKACRS